MVVIQSCDHHDESGSIPDNRSRARMLEQLQAAAALSDALALVFTEGRVDYRQRGDRPALVADLGTIATLMQTWLAWLQVAPSGDDWHAPYEPPSEIRVPPDETSAATSPGDPEAPPAPFPDPSIPAQNDAEATSPAPDSTSPPGPAT